jgi:hypothetical protein
MPNDLMQVRTIRFWALFSLKHELYKYMEIYGIMKEPTEKKKIQDDATAQARVERAPTLFFPCNLTTLLNVGAHHVPLDLIFSGTQPLYIPKHS